MSNQSKAASIASAALRATEKYEGILSAELQRAVALSEVSKWAAAQDDSVSNARIGGIAREAAALVIQVFAAGGAA